MLILIGLDVLQTLKAILDYQKQTLCFSKDGQLIRLQLYTKQDVIDGAADEDWDDDDMLQHGIVVESKSEWCFPVVLVEKKDGSTRFCVNFRRLNAVTVKDKFPLPRIDDCLDLLAGKRSSPLLTVSRDTGK